MEQAAAFGQLVQSDLQALFSEPFGICETIRLNHTRAGSHHLTRRVRVGKQQPPILPQQIVTTSRAGLCKNHTCICGCSPVLGRRPCG